MNYIGPTYGPEEDLTYANQLALTFTARPMTTPQIDLDVFRDDGVDQQQKGGDGAMGVEPSPSALQVRGVG